MDDAMLQFDPLNITGTLIFKIGSLLIPAAWTSVFISVYLLKNRIIHFYINSNMTQVEFFLHWNQQVTFCPSSVSHTSDSTSTASSSCCHPSDAWSHLE